MNAEAIPVLGRTEARYRVTEYVLSSIRSGEYAAGQQLPSARSLSDTLEVDRRTVQGALHRLKGEGYLSRRPGGGFAVLAPVPKATQSQDTVYVALSQDPELKNENKTLSGWSSFVEVGVREIEKHIELCTRILDVDSLTISGVESLASQNPTGFIYGPSLYDPSQLYKLLRPLHARNIPVVVCGDAPPLSAFDRTDSDHETGGDLLAKHLMARGCKRLAMYRAEDSQPLPYWYTARRRGYERALGEAGLPVLPVIQSAQVQTSRHEREGFEARVRLAAGFLFEHLRAGVDAILCDSDGHTLCVAEACRHLGYEPGRSVLIAGYDNYVEEIHDRRYTDLLPQVTVDKRNQQLGQAMVELLLNRIRGELPNEPQRILLEPQLVALAGQQP